MSQQGKKTIPIPAELYDRLAAELDKAGAESVDELASRILRDWVSKAAASQSGKGPTSIPPEDEKLVEERLKSLGYM